MSGTSIEAIEQLNYHAGNLDQERDVPSFVRMLRPYKGLQESSYNDVLRCLRNVAPILHKSDELPKNLVAALWALCWYPRYWALSAGGMLRRNDLITEDDQRQLSRWLDQITHTVSQLLEGVAEDEAFTKP